MPPCSSSRRPGIGWAPGLLPRRYGCLIQRLVQMEMLYSPHHRARPRPKFPPSRMHLACTQPARSLHLLAPCTRSQPPSVLAPPSSPVAPFRGQLFLLSRTHFRPRPRPRPQPASPPASWLTFAQRRFSPTFQSWRRQFSAPRSDPRRVESIRLTPVTWPNEVAFQLRNLETAPPIRPSVRAQQQPDPHRSPIPPRPRDCDYSTNSHSPSRLEALLVATHGVLGDCASSHLSLLSSPVRRSRPAQSCAAPDFLHQRRQPSPAGPEDRVTPHTIGATVCGIFSYRLPFYPRPIPRSVITLGANCLVAGTHRPCDHDGVRRMERPRSLHASRRRR
jgi:hypothetical protein